MRAMAVDPATVIVTAGARSGLALGLAGLFLEAHPDPDRALCDGPSALPLDRLGAVLEQVTNGIFVRMAALQWALGDDRGDA